jgi:hypothetical protein
VKQSKPRMQKGWSPSGGTPARPSLNSLDGAAQTGEAPVPKHGPDSTSIAVIGGVPNYLKTPNAKINITSRTIPSIRE